MQTAETESEQLLIKLAKKLTILRQQPQLKLVRLLNKPNFLKKPTPKLVQNCSNAVNATVNEAVALFSDSNILLNQLKEDAQEQLALSESDDTTSTVEVPSESQAPVHSETPEQQKALAESQKSKCRS